MIYDCFTFYNELDLLDIRFHEMYDHVDKFVLVESTKTFTYNDKPLYFHENKERYSQYSDKIIHVIVDDMPMMASAWDREYYQRNAILRGISNANPSDLIIIADVDEIISKKTLAALRVSEKVIFGFRLVFSYFKINYINTEGPEASSVSAMAARADIVASATPQKVRSARQVLNNIRPGQVLEDRASILDDSGWHFSYLGDEEFIVNKIRNFSHQEFNNHSFLSSINVEEIMRQGRDLFNRSGYVWKIVPVDDRFPETITSNISKYKKYIFEY